jgi:hypothetical protein
MIMMHPECQDRLRKEMEAVVGSDYSRMPVVEDFDQMPYFQCVLKEVCLAFPTPLSDF